MDKAIGALLIVAAVIHLLPVTGVLGAERLSTLYAVALPDPNLVVLMRHRAVLFGLLGLLLLGAAFRPAWQPLALAGGLLSVLSFLILAWPIGEYSAALRKIFVADLVALASLLAALTLYLVKARVS